MLTTAGMQQMIPFFTWTRNSSRVTKLLTSAQKMLRTTDIDKVGNQRQTFF